MERGPTNKLLTSLISKLRKEKKPFWRRIAFFLSKPRRNRIEVNVSKISRYGKEGITVVVPGKVLGDGKLSFPVVVAAFGFSKRAIKEIEEAGGKAIHLSDFYEKNKKTKHFNDFMIIV